MTTAQHLADLSTWIDSSQGDRDPEAVTWIRLAKISEEGGEVIEAYIGATGANPRKGTTHDLDDVIDELLDVATTALGAVEHLTGNAQQSIDLFEDKVRRVWMRALDFGMVPQ